MTMENSFRKGYLTLIKSKQNKQFRREFIDSFLLTCDSAFYYRMIGSRNHKPFEREFIESLFKKYGVDKSDIWGDVTIRNKKNQ